ncbi:MAG: tetratricopeptide repeat protein [Polyangiaceae bacterium]
MASESVEDGDDDETKAKSKEIKKGLLFRAARLFETAVKDHAKAEEAYAQLVALDPEDDIALIALEEIRRGLGKYEELVEMLLARSERATSASDRGRALAEIGRLYAHELDDRAQALIAYTQAFCEDPQDVTLASEIERLAGTDTNLWSEALGTITQATTADIPQDIRNALLIKLGGWYASKISRPDLALTCFSAVASTEPSNDGALEGMADIYRAAQQWPELGAVLLRRADISPSPVKARDLRAAAAAILDSKLNEPVRAKDIYETILSDDPSHEAAADALARIYERTDDYAGLIKILDRRADALRGEIKARTLVRIAEIYENNLNDLPESIQRFEAALAIDEKNLDALKGLDRVFNRLSRYRELLSVLDRQLHLAATPRQKITLHERMAAIHDEEFLDHAAASASYEAILAIDGAHENSIVALGRHYRALDRWEDVATLYDRHLKIVSDTNRRAEILLSQARVLADNVGSPERAMTAYEKVLELTPGHAGALEALARLREKTGDATAAISAIEALAEKATTPETKAEQYMRAAKLLESRGDRDGAIERYKLALDAHPQSKEAIVALRAAFAARGDVSSAIELIAREIEAAEGKLLKARLHGELARLLRDRVKDDVKAAEAARAALDNDPTNPDALLVLGDIAFEAGRFHESAKQFESLASRVESLQKQDATRVLVRFIDSLAKTGSTEKAVASIDTLLRLAPDDLEAIGRVARVTLENGTADRAYEVNKQFYERFGDQLLGHEKTEALYRLGEAARRFGKLEEAISLLQDAADLDPNSALPIEALAKVYADQNTWEEVIRIKNRRLDVLSGDERSEMLVDIGDIIANKIGDRTRAAKSFVAALEDRPDDRKLLTKLMQLYSEEKDWAKLVEIVLRLADFVDDKKQKAKYIHTAASISHKQLSDLEAAIGYYDRVLELDASNNKALTEATELRRERGDWTGVEKLVKIQLRRAQESGAVDGMIAGYDALGNLYHRQLGWTAQAIDAFEAAQALDPDNRERNERLADMYASDPAQYLDKAVSAQRVIMRRNPHKPESYKLLRRLYTEAKRADSAWCLCQALYVLNLAEPDEERFFKRMRTENVAAAQDRLSDEDWQRHLYHEDVDPLLTSLFALIEPAILGVRAQPLEALGYDARYQIDLAMHPYPISQTLYYACGVLNIAPPPTFQNPNDMGGLSFLHAHTPSIVLGRAALTGDVPTQLAAFLAARQLTFFRPGFYIRHLIPTGTGLKAWLFAAIKMIAPQFPIAGELEGPVNENIDALKAAFQGPEREHLASIVTKLLQGGGSLDLKKWVAAVDFTADRTGFVLANDLELIVELIKGSEDPSTAVPSRERLKELVLYAVSEEYFGLRDRLVIGIGA